MFGIHRPINLVFDVIVMPRTLSETYMCIRADSLSVLAVLSPVNEVVPF